MEWLLLLVALMIIAVVIILKTKKTDSKKPAVGPLPYLAKESLLTPAERSFLGSLEQAVGAEFRIYAQVRLADLMLVKPEIEKEARTAALNRITRKHVDFVLCQKEDLKISCAIELNDASHQQAQRKTRDNFVEQACQAAGLPLIQFTVKSSYTVQDIRTAINAVLNPKNTAPTQTPISNKPVTASPTLAAIKNTPQPSKPNPSKVSASIPGTAGSTSPVTTDQTYPACPKCGGETILRTVKSGPHAGKKLWGCKNYPACRGYVPQNP